MKGKSKEPRPFAVMLTDEEFQAYHEQMQKEQLLSEMLSATNKPFSVKNLKKKDSGGNISKTINPPLTGGSLGEVSDPLKSSSLNISDTDWDAIMSKASEFTPSPIDEITESELGTFRLDDSIVENPNSFDKMFKKEQTMLAELMHDVTEQARAANAKLKDMTKKAQGYGSVSKTYPDLLSAANSLNKTRLDIVSKMADLKKTVADLNFKKAKEEGPVEGTSNDELVDNFFNKVLANRKGFIDAAMSGLQQNPLETYPFEQPEGTYRPPMQPTTDDTSPQRSNIPYRSITSPLAGYTDYDEEDDITDDGDPYGYIRNEDREVSICVQRFQDGRVEFVAIDKDGEGVDDYELPADDLLLDLQIRVGSQFATDAEGRRYRIIDVDPSGVDISDIL